MLFRKRKPLELPKPPAESLQQVAVEALDLLIRSTQETKRKVQKLTEVAETMTSAK